MLQSGLWLPVLALMTIRLQSAAAAGDAGQVSRLCCLSCTFQLAIEHINHEMFFKMFSDLIASGNRGWAPTRMLGGNVAMQPIPSHDGGDTAAGIVAGMPPQHISQVPMEAAAVEPGTNSYSNPLSNCMLVHSPPLCHLSRKLHMDAHQLSHV